MILVTGAAGQLGSAIVEHLLERVSADQLAVSVQDTSKAASMAARGVDVRHGDFADPQSLDTAFVGADQVLIVSANKLGEEALRLHATAIDAAQRAGARRVLYTSHMGARRGSPFPPGDQHAGTEEDLTRLPLATVALRHGFYAESCLHMVGDQLRGDELRTPQDGPVSWTTREDLAQADAAILLDEGRWRGPTPPLTAVEAITMAQLAELASEVAGREIRHVVLPDEAWVAEQIAAGRPEMYATMLLGMFQAARRGHFAATDPALAQLLGRKPKTMRDVLVSAALSLI